MKTIDIATEVGEAFALHPSGVPLDVMQTLQIGNDRLHARHTSQRDDQTLLDIVSTAYVAGGAHSGDPITISRIISELVERRINVGAHPSYPDMFRFGQHRMDFADDEFEAVIRVQLATVATLAELHGTNVKVVKCHGALSFDVAFDTRIAALMARAVQRFDSHLALVCMAETPGCAVIKDLGVPMIPEGYIDRAYDSTARIVSRHRPDALITDPDKAAAQATSIVLDEKVSTVDGIDIRLAARSLCLHGDTPGAANIASALKRAFDASSISIGHQQAA